MQSDAIPSSYEGRIIEILSQHAEMFRTLEKGIFRIEAKLENIQINDLQQFKGTLLQIESRLNSLEIKVCGANIQNEEKFQSNDIVVFPSVECHSLEIEVPPVESAASDLCHSTSDENQKLDHNSNMLHLSTKSATGAVLAPLSTDLKHFESKGEQEQDVRHIAALSIEHRLSAINATSTPEPFMGFNMPVRDNVLRSSFKQANDELQRLRVITNVVNNLTQRAASQASSDESNEVMEPIIAEDEQDWVLDTGFDPRSQSVWSWDGLKHYILGISAPNPAVGLRGSRLIHPRSPFVNGVLFKPPTPLTIPGPIHALPFSNAHVRRDLLQIRH